MLAILRHLAGLGYLLATGQLLVPWHPIGVAAALAAGLCMAFGLLSFFQALARGPATVVVPMTALYPLITVVLAWAILKESLSVLHLLGIGLALSAVWLLSK